MLYCRAFPIDQVLYTSLYHSLVENLFDLSFFFLFTSTGSDFFTFYLFTSFLYFITLLLFTIGWVLIDTSSLSLTILILVDITFSIVYELIYYSISFLASLSLNLVLSIISFLFSVLSYSFTQTVRSWLPYRLYCLLQILP